MFVLLFAALKVAGQTTGYLRFDTVKIMKQNGSCELYIINKTKDSLGLLTNVGGGLTQFIKPKMLNDSTIVIGIDTLSIRGGGGGSTDTTSLSFRINLKLNKLDTVTYETAGSDTVIYLGTSITAGTGTTSPQYRYSTVATSKIRAYGYRFTEWNLGASGSQLLDQIVNIPRKRPGLRAMVMEFGSNELNTGKDSTYYRAAQKRWLDTVLSLDGRRLK
jgi:hypothetical protein